MTICGWQHGSVKLPTLFFFSPCISNKGFAIRVDIWRFGHYLTLFDSNSRWNFTIRTSIKITPFLSGGKSAAENGHIADTTAIGALVAERHAREIMTCAVYAVVSRASVLGDCFLIILHEILQRLQKRYFSKANYSKTWITDIRKSDRITQRVIIRFEFEYSHPLSTLIIHLSCRELALKCENVPSWNSKLALDKAIVGIFNQVIFTSTALCKPEGKIRKTMARQEGSGDAQISSGDP